MRMTMGNEDDTQHSIRDEDIECNQCITSVWVCYLFRRRT